MKKSQKKDMTIPLSKYYHNDQVSTQLPTEFFDRRIWRAQDVAKFLQCSVGHVYNLVSDEKIPKRKKNGLLFFVPNEILNWILEGDEK